MTYNVSGVINGNKEVNKNFSTIKKANAYLNNILINNDLQVEEINDRSGIQEYYCSDYTRFYVKVM